MLEYLHCSHTRMARFWSQCIEVVVTPMVCTRAKFHNAYPEFEWLCSPPKNQFPRWQQWSNVWSQCVKLFVMCLMLSLFSKPPAFVQKWPRLYRYIARLSFLWLSPTLHWDTTNMENYWETNMWIYKVGLCDNQKNIIAIFCDIVAKLSW